MGEKAKSALEEIIGLEKLFVIQPKLAEPSTYGRYSKLTEDSPEYSLLQLAGFTVESNAFHVQTSEGMIIGVKSDCFDIPKLYFQAKLPLERIGDVFRDYVVNKNLTYHAGDEHLKYELVPYGMTFSQALDVEKVVEAFLNVADGRFRLIKISSSEFPAEINEKIEGEFKSFRERAAGIYQEFLFRFLSHVDAVSCNFDLRHNWPFKGKYRCDCVHNEYDSEISITRNEVTIKLSSDPLNPEGLKYYLKKILKLDEV